MSTSLPHESGEHSVSEDPNVTFDLASFKTDGTGSLDESNVNSDSISNQDVEQQSPARSQNQNNIGEIHGLLPSFDPALIVQLKKSSSENWLNGFKSPKSAPKPEYSRFSEVFKKMVSEQAACRLGCGKDNCKYERSDCWRPEQMAIDGIFSNWINDNILACSRPTQKHTDLVKRFHDVGIRAIFNLESPDEHCSCGHGNHESGFSYNPAEYMDAGIFIYNYAMEDYGIASCERILDIMKVMNFSLRQGKIAVHCHAGLGRTGFIICSYLVHEYRMTAHDSIHYVRAKRPGSVQMAKQIDAVTKYEDFLKPRRCVFTDCGDAKDRFSLEAHLKHQQAFVHGRDSNIYRYIPRVLFVCAARLIQLCTGYMIDSILVSINRRANDKPVFFRENSQQLNVQEEQTWIDFTPSFFHSSEHLAHRDFSPYKKIISCMIASIRGDFLTSEQQAKISLWKERINKNNNGIDEIFEETDPCIISALLWTWLRLLELPIIKQSHFQLFTESDVDQPVTILSDLDKAVRGTIELCAKMFAYLRRFSDFQEDNRLLVYCIIHFLTHSPLADTDDLRAVAMNHDKIYAFLISEEANYQSRDRKTSARKKNVSTLLDSDLQEKLAAFFISIADQFQ